ncbi:MAG: helix-turn-helix domain-containing protein [Phycisphaerae bacterium]|nr:helix-turn-helix domain-containing protein [Phycisphaerae bacterium]
MTELLRKALAEAESVRAVAKATGVQQASLVRFLKGEQSLRLDMADKLAAHFGIQVKMGRKEKSQ